MVTGREGQVAGGCYQYMMCTIPNTNASAPNLSITTWDKGKYNKWLDLDTLLINFVTFFLILCIVHV